MTDDGRRSWTRRATFRAAAAAVGLIAGRTGLPAADATPVTVAHTCVGSVVSFRVLPAGSRCHVTGPGGTTLQSWMSGSGYAGTDTATVPAGTYTLRVAGSTVTCPFRLPLLPSSFEPAPAAPTTVDRGAWTAGTTYAVDDLVWAGNRRWRAVGSSSGAPPAGPPRTGERSRWTAADGG